MLSEHFSLEEMTRSGVAISNGISNTPSAADIERMRLLCVNVLEPVRGALASHAYPAASARKSLMMPWAVWQRRNIFTARLPTYTFRARRQGARFTTTYAAISISTSCFSNIACQTAVVGCTSRIPHGGQTAVRQRPYRKVYSTVYRDNA